MQTMENVDQEEINKFAKLASSWWDKNGPMAPLHVINKPRFDFILKHDDINNKQVLDLGCGAGILSETLASSGAKVTAIDMCSESINVAKQHAKQSNLSINYQNVSSAELANEQANNFDIITCMELIEHVPYPEQLISDCYKLLKPNGSLYMSTINRNPKSYLFAIVGAEYILNILPKGTHDYKKFIRPSELETIARKNNLSLGDLAGIDYNPFTKKAKLCSNTKINYLAYFKKELS